VVPQSRLGALGPGWKFALPPGLLLAARHVANIRSGGTIRMGGAKARCLLHISKLSPARSPSSGAFLWRAGNAHNSELTDLGHIITYGRSRGLPLVESRHRLSPGGGFLLFGSQNTACGPQCGPDEKGASRRLSKLSLSL
jgi:hypothetical protein